MTHDEKMKYMAIAAGVVGYKFEQRNLDLLVSLYEVIIEKQGDTDLNTISEIESQVKHRDDVRNTQELLDKISDKVR